MGRLLPSTAKDCLILAVKAPRLPLVPTLRATVLQRRLDLLVGEPAPISITGLFSSTG
jgi:hypothetical protein